MINPPFLADLRRRLRAEVVLLYVQLEQVCPQWWTSQREMAEELGVQPATLCRALQRLRHYDLIRTTGSKHGTIVWWVRRHQAETPDESLAPAWILRDRKRLLHRVPLGQERQWCKDHKVSYRSFQMLAGGHCHWLKDRWELRNTPMDRFLPELAA
jgi:hypothetical protein